MSTRGCIARLQRRAPLEFIGVYHHHESYPTGLGRALFQLWRNEFARDTEAMLRVLIDEHPAGWRTLVGTSFSKSARDLPHCNCHGDREEAGWAVTQHNAAGAGVEYAYAFEDAKMFVLGSYCLDGAKMVGTFGTGDAEAVWRIIAEIGLDGREPDWEEMQSPPPVPRDGNLWFVPVRVCGAAPPVQPSETGCATRRSLRGERHGK